MTVEVAAAQPMANGHGDETIVIKSDRMVVALQPLQKGAEYSVSRLLRVPAGQLHEPAHIAADKFQDLFVLTEGPKPEAIEADVVSCFSVWVQHCETGDRHQEKRTMEFAFQESADYSTRHAVAKDFFVRVAAAGGRDAIAFIVNVMLLLRDLPHSHVRHIDVRVERVADDKVVVVPASKDCEYDEDVEDVLAGHVQTVLEFAYPNSLPFDAIVDGLMAPPETVEKYLTELVESNIAAQLENGEYIRVNNFASAIERSLAKGDANRPPTIAIITSLFLENLAVNQIVEDAHVERMYNLTGDSNVYTLGNIGHHRVVVVKLFMIGDSREATTSAGSITTRLLGNYQNIEHVLIVGVGGGVPHYTDPAQHVRLGDVVLSSTKNGPAYVYGNELVKDRKTGRVIGLTAHKWSPKAEPLVDIWRQNRPEVEKRWHSATDQLVKKLNADQSENVDFSRPPADVDVIAVDAGEGGDAIVAPHPNADRLQPTVHEATVASMLRYAPPISLDDTDTPISQPNAQALRNGFLHEYNAKCFDAGFDSVISSIQGNCINSYVLIRSIADYHNGSSKVARQWQPYAAANAAALTKVLIEMLPADQ